MGKLSHRELAQGHTLSQLAEVEHNPNSWLSVSCPVHWITLPQQFHIYFVACFFSKMLIYNRILFRRIICVYLNPSLTCSSKFYCRPHSLKCVWYWLVFASWCTLILHGLPFLLWYAGNKSVPLPRLFLLALFFSPSSPHRDIES